MAYGFVGANLFAHEAGAIPKIENDNRVSNELPTLRSFAIYRFGAH